MADENIKEIFLTSNAFVGSGSGSGSAPESIHDSHSQPLFQKGRGRRRRTRKSPEQLPGRSTDASATTATVTKKPDTVVVEKTSKQKPIVVLSPPRKKTARILLVSAKTEKADPKHVSERRKTFRAKRVTVTIDNTAKTAKRKNLLMKQVDGLTQEQLREAIVTAKLARRETVAKVPEKLLRQMLKDYQSIRGAYV